MSFKNQLNRYTCRECGGHIITVDSDDGTTPFMLGCRVTAGCIGMMQSSFYRNVNGTPTFEWRKPTNKEYFKTSAAMRQHFDMGGLDIYPLERK